MSASTVSKGAYRRIAIVFAFVAGSALLPLQAWAQSAVPACQVEAPPSIPRAAGNFIVSSGDVAAAAAFVQRAQTFAAVEEPVRVLVRVPSPADILQPAVSPFAVTDVDVVEVAAFMNQSDFLARLEGKTEDEAGTTPLFSSITLTKTARLRAQNNQEFAELHVSRSARTASTLEF